VKEGENIVNEGNISFQYFLLHFLNLYKPVGYYCIFKIRANISIIFSKAQPNTLTFVTKVIVIFLYCNIDIVYEK